jgi:outer membrane protein assembly factor BamB
MGDNSKSGTTLSSDELEVLKAYIRSRCLFRWRDSAPILRPDGSRYSWLFDFFPLLLDGQMAQLVAQLFWQEFRKFWPFQLAAVELAAVPLVTALSIEGAKLGLPTNVLIVRKKRSKSGRLRLIEGDSTKDLPVVLIDDAINSASSINKALSAIMDIGLAAEHAFAIAHFHSERARAWCGRNKITIHHLVTPQDFYLRETVQAECQSDFKLRWTFASSPVNYRFAVAKSTPALDGDNVMFGSDSGIFWCLDRRTGRIKWWYRTNDQTSKGIVSSPVVVDGRVYFGSYSGNLCCLEAESGMEIWNVKPCQWIGSSPCYAEGAIYIGLEFESGPMKGALAKFSASSGTIEWKIPTARMLHGSPVYSQKHSAIVVGTNDSTVLVVDAQTGEVRKALEVGGPVKYHCAVVDDVAVFGSFDHKIYVWDFVADVVKLEIQTDDIVYTRPLIVDKRVFVGSADHTFVVIDLVKRCVIKRLDVGEKVHSSAALIGGTVFFGTSGGELIGLDPITLDITHRFQFPERLTNTPVSDGTTIFVHAFDNKLWAIQARTFRSNKNT